MADSGVIGFVSNAGFVEANTADGLRKCLAEEFSNIYVFNLRGESQEHPVNCRRKERGQYFWSGQLTGIAITPVRQKSQCRTTRPNYYHDIGDNLNREEKLEKISAFNSINGISEANGWQANHARLTQ